MASLQTAIAQEAARIICEELLTDYGLAKRKAAQRLGTSGAMPENFSVQQAVLEYQRLFGGAGYRAHLHQMRQMAVQSMRWLGDFTPRLVGGAVSGAVTAAHRVQLHLFADQPEMLDVFLLDQGCGFEHGERSYRYPDGREVRIPIAHFDVGPAGVDAAVFPENELRRPPVNPADGRPFRRLALAEAEALSALPAA
jgi:hypothetical protein